jgi:hypothetical protein
LNVTTASTRVTQVRFLGHFVLAPCFCCCHRFSMPRVLLSSLQLRYILKLRFAVLDINDSLTFDIRDD